MNRRLFLTILCFSCASLAIAGTADSQERSFGPESGPVLSVVAPESRIAELSAALAENPPASRVVLIPSTAEKAAPHALTDNMSTALVILPGKEGKTVVCNGARGKTSPVWLFTELAAGLDASGEPWRLAEYRMPLYRLGWTPENPHLALWLDAGIPAIQIETDTLPLAAIARLSAYIASGVPTEEDAHYLVYRVKDGYRVLSETAMVLTIIIASAVILFFLFIFSFLFGEKSDQRLRDLLRVLWLPFLYLTVTILSFHGAQTLVALLVRFRFGSAGAWTLLPSVVFISKLAVSGFFITLVVSLNQLIKFPEDNFIYGYIASVICLINIFVFSSFDFSFSALFLSVYLISFLVYHVRTPAGQIAGIVAMVLPFIPYFQALLRGDTVQVASNLAALYDGADLWNVRLALLVMPFQLLVSRFSHTVGLFGQRQRFRVPVNLFIVFFIAVFCGSLILFMPAWSKEKPLVVKIVQTVNGDRSLVDTSSLVKISDLDIERVAEAAFMPSLSETAESIIPVTSVSRKFLERQIISVTMDPAIPFDVLELRISGGSDVPVHDASEPFEVREAGSICVFVHEPDSDADDGPWTVNFSSGYDSVLTATVTLKTRVNPWGLSILNENIKTEYSLDASATKQITGEP